MSEEMIKTKGKDIAVRVQGGNEVVYSLGVIGAAVYYINKGQTTEEKVKGFLKALVWPAYLVYELFKFIEK